MQPVALCDAAQPLTVTLLTEPFDENVTFACEMSSAPATHDFASPATARIDACTAPCGGCSGMFWFRGPDAGSALSLVAAALLEPSEPTACAIAPFKSPGFDGVSDAGLPAGLLAVAASDGGAGSAGAAPPGAGPPAPGEPLCVADATFDGSALATADGDGSALA